MQYKKPELQHLVKRGIQINENSYQKQKLGNMMKKNVDIYVNLIIHIIQKLINVNLELEHNLVEEIFQNMQRPKKVTEHISKHGTEHHHGSQQFHGQITEMSVDLRVIQITI